MSARGVGLRYGELFAGAGGLSYGLECAGLECAWHAELDENPRAVLRHRWPNVPLYGDVCELDGAELIARHGPIDMLTGGSPCQDLSVAGKRAGLAGARSSLFHHQMRLWQETAADLCLWENVFGALSSNAGQDFAAVLGTFVGAAVPVPSDGWRSAGVVAGPAGVAAWRCLDCQWFGPPQRRLRVFVLGTRAGGIDPAEVLLEPQSLRRNPPTRREAGERIADSVTVGANQTSGFVGDVVSDEERGGLTGAFAERERAGKVRGFGGVVPALMSDTGETGNMLPSVVAFTQNQMGDVLTGDTMHSLATNQNASGRSAPTVLAFHHTQDPISGPSAPCLGAEGMGVLAFNAKQDGSDADALAPKLLGMPHADSHANGGGQVAVCVTGEVTHSLTHEGYDSSEDGTGRGTPIIARMIAFGEYQEDLIASAIKSRDHKDATDLIVAGTLGAEHARKPSAQEASQGRVPVTLGIPRRLTPRECERLMGWPDDWTLVRNGKGKPMSDAARYKMIGNGVASPVVQWIAGRLLQHVA